MSSKTIAMFAAPASPRAAEAAAAHVELRAKAKRQLAAKLIAEAEELELTALRMRKSP
jgi:hypothetical protein